MLAAEQQQTQVAVSITFPTKTRPPRERDEGEPRLSSTGGRSAWRMQPTHGTWTRVILPGKISVTNRSPVVSSRTRLVGDTRLLTNTTGTPSG